MWDFCSFFCKPKTETLLLQSFWMSDLPKSKKVRWKFALTKATSERIFMCGNAASGVKSSFCSLQKIFWTAVLGSQASSGQSFPGWRSQPMIWRCDASMNESRPIEAERLRGNEAKLIGKYMEEKTATIKPRRQQSEERDEGWADENETDAVWAGNEEAKEEERDSFHFDLKIKLTFVWNRPW